MGVGGNEGDNSTESAGAAYVFVRSGVVWSRQAYIKASNTDEFDLFGSSLALSADGSTLAVGATLEASDAASMDGDQAVNTEVDAGAAYTFTRNGTTWSQQAYVKASNVDTPDQFGRSIALSADGSTLAVGSRNEASDGTGVGGDQANNDAPVAGAVYLY